MWIRNLSKGGGLIMTYRCTAACAHCLYKSSPNRESAYMEERVLRKLLRKAVSLGCRSFHIGGGEPFLDPDALVRVIRVIREEGVGIDYLETNGFWYQDPDSAALLLERILDAGCHTLMVSLCPFHIPFVPLYKVEGAMAAAQRVGMEYFLWQEQYYRELSDLDNRKTHSLEELSERFGPNYIIQAAARFGLWVNGRALQTLNPYLEHKTATEIIETNPVGCQELTRTGHFHLDLYGNYVPPGCVGFALDHRCLGEELSEQYPLYRLLVEEGIRGLYEHAQKHHGFTPRPDGYVSKCDLCYSIRKALMDGMIGLEGTIPYPELGPLEFYRLD
ncbi:MAG: radical SAM protein [Spirochaetes bacterium]|nr:radical SAM protein [Spirochaetota bacterium]